MYFILDTFRHPFSTKAPIFSHQTPVIGFILAFFMIICTSARPSDSGYGTLSVEVSGIRSSGGSIRVVIYNSEGTFLDSKRFSYVQAVPVTNQQTIRVDFYLPHATYAVTCYHDMNNNRKMDQSTLGWPEEPYALSNNVSVKWRKPTFNETKFVFSKSQQTLPMRLMYWQER